MTIISQYIQISNYYPVNMKVICCMSITPRKKGSSSLAGIRHKLGRMCKVMHYGNSEEEEITSSSQDHEDLMGETLLKLCFDQSGNLSM